MNETGGHTGAGRGRGRGGNGRGQGNLRGSTTAGQRTLVVNPFAEGGQSQAPGSTPAVAQQQYYGQQQRGGGYGGRTDQGGRDNGDSTTRHEQKDRIFVRGIPNSWTVHSLIAHFGQIGIIQKDERTGFTKVQIYTDKITGLPNGKASVTYSTEWLAQEAIKRFDGQCIPGANSATLKVEIFKPKRPVDSSGGGRGSRGGGYGGDRGGRGGGFGGGGGGYGGDRGGRGGGFGGGGGDRGGREGAYGGGGDRGGRGGVGNRSGLGGGFARGGEDSVQPGPPAPKFRLELLSQDDSMFIMIKEAMRRSIVEHRGAVGGLNLSYNLVKVEKITNDRVWERYIRRRGDIAEENGGQHNETVLFHGSPCINDIIEKGFDERHAKPNGMFGAGVYFAEHSSKSNQYVFGTAGGNGCTVHSNKACNDCDRQLLQCRVTLGKVSVQEQSTTMSHAPVGHHSVLGKPSSGGLHYPEYIIYRGEQAYPEYLITYRTVRVDKPDMP